MNRPARVALGLVLCATVAAPLVRGQDVPPAVPAPPTPSLPPGPGATPSGANPNGTGIGGTGLSADIKNANNLAPYTDQIQAFIQQKLDAVTTADPAAQKAGRQALIGECSNGGTPAYLNTYAGIVNTAVLAILNRPSLPPIRVRLNLAIIVESVGFSVKNNTMQPVVLKLLTDPAEPVLIWAVRSARPIIATGVAAGALPGPLMVAVLAAVKSHPAVGLLADEGYHAVIADGEGVNVGTNPATLTSALQAFLDIWNFRVALYARSIPDDPAAESFTRFLSTNRANYTPAQTQQVVQALFDLISVIGARAPEASKPQLDALVATLRNTAQAMQVFTGAADSSALGGLAHTVSSAGGTEVAKRVTAAVAQVRGQYSFLHAAPQIATTGPTTATTAAH